MMTPLDTATVRENMPKILNRNLQEAYKIAGENRSLDFFRQALAARDGGFPTEQTVNLLAGTNTPATKATMPVLENSNKANSIWEKSHNKANTSGGQSFLNCLENPSWPLGRVDDMEFSNMDEIRVRTYWAKNRDKESHKEYVPSRILSGDNCKYCNHNTHRGSAGICEAFHYSRRWHSLKYQIEMLDKNFQVQDQEGRRRDGIQSFAAMRSNLEPEVVKRSVGRPRKYDR
jgi:hypothetical protein